jgi:AraC-like DNA-binding protein
MVAMLHSHLTTLHTVALILQTLCSDDGISAEDLLAGSGIRLDDLQRSETRITISQEMRVCANAAALRNSLGLELGLRMHVSAYGMLGYALLASPTLGDALRLALDYPALLGTYFGLSLQQDGDLVWLRADGYREQQELEAFHVEFCLASLKLICDDLLGATLPLAGARFRHTAPDYREQYLRSFACPLNFQAEDNAFGFASSWLAQPLPLADPITYRDMREQCRQRNNEFVHRQTLIVRIRLLLRDRLADAPSLEQLAQQVHCSARSLRRHLQAAGTSYQALLDELRYEKARELLSQGQMPICRIAEAMGYSETASFRHAFQRWSGLPPSRFRG